MDRKIIYIASIKLTLTRKGQSSFLLSLLCLVTIFNFVFKNLFLRVKMKNSFIVFPKLKTRLVCSKQEGERVWVLFLFKLEFETWTLLSVLGFSLFSNLKTILKLFSISFENREM